jgi:hypothetical protein
MNIQEDYVSFETAKLLREKGFDQKCQKVYMHDGQLLWSQIFMEGESFVDNKCIELVANYNDWITYTQGEYAYLCPTIQMVMKWLREVHGLFISIGNDDLDYNWQIFDIKNRTKDLDPTCLTDSYAGYRKYELATETAIKYCLKNLI